MALEINLPESQLARHTRAHTNSRLRLHQWQVGVVYQRVVHLHLQRGQGLQLVARRRCRRATLDQELILAQEM